MKIESKQESIQNGIEKYPMELEEQAKKSMLIKDKEQLKILLSSIATILSG